MATPNPLILKLQQSGILLDEDHPILAGLCESPRTVPADTILVQQGEKPSGVHLILGGFACRSKLLPGGEWQILSLLLPGDFCDIHAAALGRSDHFTTTLTDCAVVRLSHEAVGELTLTDTRIARALWWSRLVDERILRAWLTSMGQRRADEWLAHFCCELLLRLQVVGCAEADACEMPLTQDQLGHLLGITDVHVSRVLRELRDRDLLELKNRRLSVPDVERLRAFCGFDPDYLHFLGGRPAASARVA